MHTQIVSSMEHHATTPQGKFSAGHKLAVACVHGQKQGGPRVCTSTAAQTLRQPFNWPYRHRAAHLTLSGCTAASETSHADAAANEPVTDGAALGSVTAGQSKLNDWCQSAHDAAVAASTEVVLACFTDSKLYELDRAEVQADESGPGRVHTALNILCAAAARVCTCARDASQTLNGIQAAFQQQPALCTTCSAATIKHLRALAHNAAAEQNSEAAFTNCIFFAELLAALRNERESSSDVHSRIDGYSMAPSSALQEVEAALSSQMQLAPSEAVFLLVERMSEWQETDPSEHRELQVQRQLVASMTQHVGPMSDAALAQLLRILQQTTPQLDVQQQHDLSGTLARLMHETSVDERITRLGQLAAVTDWRNVPRQQVLRAAGAMAQQASAEQLLQLLAALDTMRARLDAEAQYCVLQRCWSLAQTCSAEHSARLMHALAQMLVLPQPLACSVYAHFLRQVSDGAYQLNTKTLIQALHAMAWLHIQGMLLDEVDLTAMFKAVDATQLDHSSQQQVLFLLLGRMPALLQSESQLAFMATEILQNMHRHHPSDVQHMHCLTRTALHVGDARACAMSSRALQDAVHGLQALAAGAVLYDLLQQRTSQGVQEHVESNSKQVDAAASGPLRPANKQIAGPPGRKQSAVLASEVADSPAAQALESPDAAAALGPAAEVNSVSAQYGAADLQQVQQTLLRCRTALERCSVQAEMPAAAAVVQHFLQEMVSQAEFDIQLQV